MKIDEKGAAATLLTFHLERQAGADPASRIWSAWAVGDSCLFHVRDGQVLACFPLCHSRMFKVAPSLLKTLPGEPPVPLRAGGKCKLGDLFVLATDAVAQWLLARVEAGDPPDWESYLTMDEETWRRQIDSARQSPFMVNDDCTLVAVSIAPSQPAPQ